MGEQQIVILIIITIAVMLLLAFTLVLFFNFSQRKIISEQKKNHEQRMTFQKEMLESTVRVQEEERKRISAELHDDISSKLNVINMNVNFLKMKYKDRDESELIGGISNALDHAINRSRTISHELMPPLLDKFGLNEAINGLSDQINSSGKLKFSVEGNEFLKLNDKEKKLHIFRIIQELCNNTLKHANASEILLKFEQGSEFLHLSYEDNGKGFNPDDQKHGAGMMNLESRVQILGGKWENIEVNKGVKFKIKIPYAKTNNPDR